MTEHPPKQATLHDVARLAGVSHQTVSRVINDHPSVLPATRERVLEAIRALDYRPNRAARSLITGRSQTIQAINFKPYFMGPLKQVIYEAASCGYHVGISNLSNAESFEEFRLLMDELTSRVMDGFIFFESELDLRAEELNRMCRGVPYIKQGGNPGDVVASVVFDQRAGMNQVMDHLLGLGHRRIAEIVGWKGIYDARIRHDIYLERMAQAGLEPGPITFGDFSARGGYEAANQLLDSGQPFTALVCANDTTAIGALRALHERGLRVPEDVSVVGYDDNSEAPYLEAPLTTVRQDYDAQGVQTVKMLVDMIANPHTEHHPHLIYPELIVRQSTRAV